MVLVLLLNKRLHLILLVEVFGLLSKLANLTKIHYSANCHRDTVCSCEVVHQTKI